MKAITEFFKEMLTLFVILWLLASASITLALGTIFIIFWLCGDEIDPRVIVLSVFGISTSLYFLFTIGNENVRKFFSKRLWK